MDPREFIRSNGYLGPDLVSVGQVFMYSEPGTNWVSSCPPFLVTLDPQFDPGSARRRAGMSETFGYTRSAVLDYDDAEATLTERAGELRQMEQVFRELRPEEGVQKPSTRDLRQNYRRYDLPG